MVTSAWLPVSAVQIRYALFSALGTVFVGATVTVPRLGLDVVMVTDFPLELFENVRLSVLVKLYSDRIPLVSVRVTE